MAFGGIHYLTQSDLFLQMVKIFTLLENIDGSIISGIFTIVAY